MIRLVQLDQVDTVWPLIAEGIKEACRRGRGSVNPDWLFGLCRRGEAYLFVYVEGDNIRAAYVCQVQDWPSGQVLNILVLCGEGWEEWIPLFRDFCATFNVKRVVFSGRKGLGSIKGARLLHSTYELDLTDGG